MLAGLLANIRWKPWWRWARPARKAGRGRTITGYLRKTSIVSDVFTKSPGNMSVAGNVRWMQRKQTRGRAGDHFPAMKRDGSMLRIGSGCHWKGKFRWTS